MKARDSYNAGIRMEQFTDRFGEVTHIKQFALGIEKQFVGLTQLYGGVNEIGECVWVSRLPNDVRKSVNFEPMRGDLLNEKVFDFLFVMEVSS